MKKTILLITLIVVLTLFTACSSTEITAEVAVLTVGGKAYTHSELEALGTQSTDYTNKDNETTTYTGTPLSALLEDAGLTSAGDTLVFTAADGYKADMTLDEALDCTGCIVANDSGSLRAVMPDLSSKLQVKDLIIIDIQ
jgi:hypothetical protein